MTSPPRTANERAAPLSTRPARIAVLRRLLIPALIYAFLLLSHWPLLNQPYDADEAAYLSTEIHARPPLVPVYLAAWRKAFGESIVVARMSMLLVAALALYGLWRLAARAANGRVAWASVVCTAVYAVFFVESARLQADVAVAACIFRALLYYLPPEAEASGVVGTHTVDELNLRRRFACVVWFGLAGLARETAVLAPLALMVWEVLSGSGARKFETAAVLRTGVCRPARRRWWWPLLLPLVLLPLAVWLVYRQQQTGQLSGDAGYTGARLATTLSLWRVSSAALTRLWQATAHMNLYVLSVPTVLLTLLASPVRDEGVERGRIEVSVQLSFAAIALGYIVGLSLLAGDAKEARDMLPVVPLLIVICVSTIWRRVRYWQFGIAVACAALAFGIFRL